MKKILLLAVLLTFSAVTLCAQSMQETVYLKNGSIIKGIIVEQVPGKSMKIQTKDGSLFVCQMTEVEKITKEAPDNRTVKGNSRLHSGYRGFVDLNWALGVGQSEGANSIGIQTSHGYQIIPQLYAGAGIGLNVFYNGTAVNLPIFANLRTDILSSGTTPFVDLKVGYSLIDIKGLYLSPSIGCRINLSKSLGLNIGLGYTLQNIKYDYGYAFSFNSSSINIKVGIEF